MPDLLPPSRALGNRSVALDAIRGLAILQVVLSHYVLDLTRDSADRIVQLIHRALALTWTGVDLFFVLSGFLIGGILMDNRTSERFFGPFYARRFLRIVPLYIALIVVGVVAGEQNSALWSYPFFLQNVIWSAEHNFGPFWTGATWSLAVEEQFYLVLPLMVRTVTPRVLPIVLACLIVLAPMCRIVAVQLSGSPLPAFFLMPCRMDSLFMGVLLAWALRDPHATRWIARKRGWPLATAFCILGGGVALLLRYSPSFLTAPVWTLGYTWIAAFYAVLILIASSPAALRWTRVARPLSWLGLGAYSIYLFHRPLQGIAQMTISNGQTTLVAIVTSSLAVLLVAWVCWRFVEHPMIRYGQRRFRYRINPIPASVATT